MHLNRKLIILIAITLLNIQCDNSFELQDIKEIESKLGINTSNNNLADRLKIINERLDSIIDYNSSVFVFENRDTIAFGEVFQAEIIPVKTFNYEKSNIAVVSIADSILKLERRGINKASYGLETSHYKKGLNIAEGIVTVGNDTVSISFSFYVK